MQKEEPYIPENLVDCFAELEKLLDKDVLESFKKKNEEDLPLYQFDLARWLRGRWGLWQGSRLAEFFKSIGIFHADDMSAIVLISFHRYLNNRYNDIPKLFEYFRDYWDGYKGEVADWDWKYLKVSKRRLREMRTHDEGLERE
jgi:hypothetical protein